MGLHFEGAHHLDQLRVEDAPFAATPGGWRWSTRQAIAEEHLWRSSDWSVPFARRRGWYGQKHRPPPWLSAGLVRPAQLAEIYRALRKGREDAKDEPGAADFYYGEMEMRRLARRWDARQARRDKAPGPLDRRRDRAGDSHGLLARQRLRPSGLAGAGDPGGRRRPRRCGLRLVGLAAPEAPSIRAVAVDARGAPVYAVEPSERPAGLDELPAAVRFSAQSATSLLRGPERPLTPLGEWLHLGLRLAGPVLLGLAVISVRGRVKR